MEFILNLLYHLYFTDRVEDRTTSMIFFIIEVMFFTSGTTGLY